MTIEVTDNADLASVQEIRDANDRFRHALSGGIVLLSADIIALGGQAQTRILEAVRAFDDFDVDDRTDTYDLGDFVIEVGGQDASARSELIFFRIDQPSATSNDPHLTIFLASEWWSTPTAFQASTRPEARS